MKTIYLFLFMCNTSVVWIQKQLTWLVPQTTEPITTTAAQLDIQLSLTGVSNINPALFKVLINGRPIAPNSSVEATKFDNTPLSKKGYIYQKTIPLTDGGQEIVVVYQDGTEEVRSPVLQVSRPPKQPIEDIRPNLYVLTLGPSTNLQFTVKDACDFANAFRGQATGNNRIYKSVTIKSLLGKDATGAAMMQTIERMERIYGAQKTLYLNSPEVQSNDLLVIYLSSHGFRDNSEYYIMGSDADLAMPRTSSVRLSFIMEMLEKLPCRKLLFIDACQNAIDKIPNSVLPTLILKQDNLAVFTSASAGEKSFEDSAGQQGAFTKILFDGLHGAADKDKNGAVSLLELSQYLPPSVQAFVSDMTRGFMRQTPQLIHNTIGDIDFFQTANFHQRYFLPCQFETGAPKSIVGLRLSTTEGIDDGLTQQVVKSLKDKGLRADFFDGIATKSFSSVLIGDFDYQKTDTETIGVSKVNTYRVTLLLKSIDGETGKPCATRKVETTASVYDNETQATVKQYCINALLTALKTADVPTCR